MTFLPAFQASYVSTATSLVDARSVASGSATTTSSVATGALDLTDLPVGSLIVACLAARDDVTGHVEWTTPGLSDMTVTGAGWTKREVVVLDAGTSRYVSATIYMAVVATNGGAAVITFNSTGSCFSLLYNLLVVDEGFNVTPSSYPNVTNSATATSLALNLGSAPASTSMNIAWAAMNGAPAGAFTVPTGMTAYTQVAQGTALTAKGGRKLLSPNQNNSYTALDGGDATAGVLVEILQL